MARSAAGSAAPARSRPSSARRSRLADGEARLVKVEGGCASEGTIEVLVEPQLRAAPRRDRRRPGRAHAGGARRDDRLAGLDRARRRRRRRRRRLDGPGRRERPGGRARRRRRLRRPGGEREAGSAVLADLAPRRRRGDARPDRCPPASTSVPRARRRSRSRSWPSSSPGATRPGATAELIQAVEPIEAIDPVCGMTVSIAGARETAVHEATYYFCGAGCRKRFEADPARYLTTA